SVICTLCTGFFCLAIIKGPPNDIYFIIEGPCDGYFTEKVSQARFFSVPGGLDNTARRKKIFLRYCFSIIKHFYIIDIILIIQYVNDIILIKTKQFTTYLSNLPTPARILSRFQIMLFNNVS
ncbi:hypothetical protein NE634_12850, partial [Lacrimispora saccharolytica]|nr:hypothetical protein [Lacrimispora saccharolytica]